MLGKTISNVQFLVDKEKYPNIEQQYRFEEYEVIKNKEKRK